LIHYEIKDIRDAPASLSLMISYPFFRYPIKKLKMFSANLRML